MTLARPAGDKASSADWPALMARAQAGDQQAYARLLRAMLPAIQRLVRRAIQDEALAEDVVQDVLLTVHRIRHTYDPDRPILPWLAAIVTARAIDALRARGRRQRWELNDDEALLELDDPTASRPLEGLAARQELERHLQRLPGRQRAVMELVHLREMSLADAADASSLTLSAVKALLHRALSTLRRNRNTDHG